MSQPNQRADVQTEAELRQHIGDLEAQLAQRDALLRELLAVVPVGVVVQPHAAGQPVLNARAAEFVGANGSPLTPLLRADGSPLREEELPTARALRGEAVGGREAQRMGPDGAMVPVMLNAVPVRNGSGEVTHAITTYQDLSPHPSVNAFLAHLSHELRTPMSSILGWARLLADQQVPPEKRAHGIAVIQRNASRQLQLIEDLLDTSLLLTGQMPLNPQPIDAEAIVKQALESVSPLASTKRISMSAHVSADVREAVLDPDRLHQLVWNLLANAIRSTGDNGKIDLRVSKVGGDLKIEVADTGEGIEPAVLPYIFDRFTPTGSELAPRRGKIGVGLALMKPVIDRQGGTIQASSQGVGQGTTFVVTLPMKPVPPSVASPIAGAEAPSASPNLAGRTVLVVEDERDTRELLKAVLQGTSAKVMTASDGIDALEKLEHGNVDLVVSDVGMPLRDGYDLMRLIRLAETSGVHVPAVALTALAQDEDRARALAAGFDVHVAKPVDPRKLVNLVASLLAGSALGGGGSGLKN